MNGGRHGFEPAQRLPIMIGRWALTGLFGLITVVAVASWLAGNPTAINGVIGAGLGTAILATMALIEGPE
jgi:hypothetical protein